MMGMKSWDTSTSIASKIRQVQGLTGKVSYSKDDFVKVGTVDMRHALVVADIAIAKVANVLPEAERNPVVLALVAVPPVPLVSPKMIAPTTIVPEMTNSYGQVGGTVRAQIAESTMQAIGAEAGVLMIQIGKRVLGMIAMKMADEAVFKRLGQRLDSALRLKFDTQQGEGRGRHVNVRGRDGATPGDQSDVYDDPSYWWQFGL